jgi:cell division protease FtsH
MSPDVDLNRIASRTPGFTGADLASVVNEAALLTIRRKGSTITMKEFEEAVVRVLEGPQRRGQVLTEAERTRAAYHEIGHVVVAATLGRHEDVHRVTVLGRGRTIAAATFADKEATLLTRSALHTQLVATLGGIAAEELVFGEGSTGGEQDLEHATDLARDMVTKYGMSDEVGPVRLQVAMTILRSHRRELDTLAARLDAEETLEDEVLQEALAPLLSAIESKSTSSGTRAPAPRRRKAPARTAAASVNGSSRARAAAKS